MGTKRKSPLKSMIDESLAKLQNSGFESDPTLEDDGRELTGPERFAKGQKARDEMVIDNQLADIQGKEGYFLKLKKELRPNEWMLMKVIESEWRKWPDIETEVAKLVKEHTKTAPTKWGSGAYKIEFGCKGGIRGKNYPDLFYTINAEEEFLNNGLGGSREAISQSNAAGIDATTQVTSQLDMLARLMDVMKGVQPVGIDPAAIQKQNADAFQQGLAAKTSEGNSNNQMMTAMITGLMGMMTAMATNKPVVEAPRVVNPTEGMKEVLETLKTFGVLGTNQHEKPKTTMEFLAELKMLGMDVLKKDDPMEQITKLKQLANIAGEFMGMGSGNAEKPGILEKIVDMVGPAIPGMIKDLKETANSAVAVQVEAGRNIERAKIAAPVVHPNNEGMNMNAGNPGTPVANPQVQAFFQGFYEAANANNRTFYPIIYTSLLQDPQGVALVNGIIDGSKTAKELIEMLQSHGDARFKDSEFVMKCLVSYVNGFIMWLRDLVKPKSYGEVIQEQTTVSVNGNGGHVNGNTAPTEQKYTGYDVGCGVCGAVFVYDSAEQFAQEEHKTCDANGCTGVLQSVASVS